MSYEEDLREATREATRQYLKDEEALRKSREAVAAAIVVALRGGVRPTDVEEDSPYKAARIRQIARENGVPAADRSARLD